jgi:pimeloyl-ACP methyl ester carboxylesterase
LFGYSGGGALAVLVAAKRNDVIRVVTIAGNLDHAAWTRAHGDAPLTGSLNPAEAADRISRIRQIHFIGRDDEIVPPAIAASYLGRVADRSNISVIEVPGADHTCCWAEKWPALLRAHVYPGRPETPT